MAKILVADDEQMIREVIREYSEFNGHEVTEAADGMTAVGLCKLNDYDLIIMDIMMPKLDGYSACKEIRKVKDTPIIMLSARSEEYDKDAAAPSSLLLRSLPLTDWRSTSRPAQSPSTERRSI